MKVKAYKMEVYVLDFDDSGNECVIQEVEDSRYVSVRVKDAVSIEIDNWNDNHLLNKRVQDLKEVRKLFDNAEEVSLDD